MKRTVTLILVLALAASVAFAEDGFLNHNDGVLDVELVAETGFVKVLTHTIQIGEANPVFDYVNQGGQELLSPFSRVTAELTVADQHTVVFLYQPLELATQSRFDADVTIDDVTFESGQVVDILYSFPFYRISYLYDFAADPQLELAAGLSLQLRNASIRWESIDVPTTGGNNAPELVVSQNLGPVPIIKLRGEYRFDGNTIPGAFIGLEADGFYASSAFINGAGYAFEGSIFDVSLRAGFEPTPGLDLFMNVRGLGGGGKGTRGDARETWTESRDGFTDNFLTTLSVTLGARVR
jgi:hypothetical protein